MRRVVDGEAFADAGAVAAAARLRGRRLHGHELLQLLTGCRRRSRRRRVTETVGRSSRTICTIEQLLLDTSQTYS